MARLSVATLWPFLLCACSGAQEVSDSSTQDTAMDGVFTPSIDDRACPPDSYLTWENFGEGFMRDNCTGCHSELLGEDQRVGAPLDVNFNTQAQVQDQADRIYARSADDNDTMPVVDTLSSEERFLLGEWLACGAL